MDPDVPESERAFLLKLARLVIEAHVAGRDLQSIEGPPAITRSAGAFVTLTRDGELRGCIGYPEADRPLVEVIVGCAAAAASRDPRFEPLSLLELTEIQIEISILGPLLPVFDVSEILVGRDGLVVEQGGRRGLLLPQVASERDWSEETFLEQTCLKAGLAADAWRAGAQVFRFEAHVFGET
jgi:AmmeMemoRadiSam system protein A